MCFTCRPSAAFTLIELLVVVTVISVVLALLMPALHQARVVSRRLACQNNVKQITLAWHMYFDDHNDRFYQGPNVNHDFGGWKGRGGYALCRPLNPYLKLPLEMETGSGARVFRCPADSGGIFNRPPQQLAYDYFGNSYETNFILIGPNQIPVPADDREELFQEVNERLKDLSRGDVSEPGRLLLLGDNNWVTQWDESLPVGSYWHGRRDCYNVSFLDGHIDFVRIRKGPFLTPEYRVLAFADLDQLAPTPPE
jgi:prepilin-type N-terminal cleavage/methylation domain-containing protein/prepilin-type processing-associated H-X9-DG protein